MRKDEVRVMRMDLGKFLHSYYVKFGEEKYDRFLDKLGKSMGKSYGEAFSSDNLRIMEAEYVTLSKRIKGESKKNTIKQ